MGGKKIKPVEAKPQEEDLTGGIKRSWDAARFLFDKKSMPGTFSAIVPIADFRLSAILLILSSVIVTLISFAATLESMQLANFTSDTLGQVSGTALPKVGPQSLVPIMIFQVIFNIPFALLLQVVFESAAFGLFKVSGGKGSFKSQFFLTSVIALSMAFASILNLLLPLPCIAVIGALALIAITAYMVLYVTPKAYMEVHKVTFMHAFVVALVTLIPRMAAIFLAINILGGLLSLPTAAQIPSGG